MQELATIEHKIAYIERFTGLETNFREVLNHLKETNETKLIEDRSTQELISVFLYQISNPPKRHYNKLDQTLLLLSEIEQGYTVYSYGNLAFGSPYSK